MLPVVALIFICVATWYFVKQTAVTFDRPKLWDNACIIAGTVGTIGFAYVHHPYVWTFDKPLHILTYRSLVFGVSVALLALFYGISLEDAELIRTPESLAPVDARFHEQVSSVDELDKETLAEYMDNA